MKKSLIVMAILMLFLAGCATQRSPAIVCSAPYIRHADACCLDKNSNDICDSDEEEEPLFVEPDYAESVPDITYQEPVYVPPAEENAAEAEATPEEEGVFVGEKTDVQTVSTKYAPSAVKLAGWIAENDHMRMEITRIVIDVNSIEQVDLRSPDQEAYLKEIYLTVKNKDYSYINPTFRFRVGDSSDPIRISEVLNCGEADDIKMEGCKSVPEAESMHIRMVVNAKIARLDLLKTITLSLQNKRDTLDENILTIQKQVDILDIFGAEYI